MACFNLILKKALKFLIFKKVSNSVEIFELLFNVAYTGSKTDQADHAVIGMGSLL